MRQFFLRHRISILFPVAIILGGVFYYIFDPSAEGFMIVCPWKLLTSTQCPACGMQRAVHSLLHGSPAIALRYNYFFIISIPFAIIVVLSEWYNFNHVFDKLHDFIHRKEVLYSYVAVFCLWWILRNVLKI